MSYKAYVVEIQKLRKHNNADRLQIATVFGNDVSVGLDIKVGDVMIYFPTDGKLSREFAEANNLVRLKDQNGNNIGGYLDPEKRNIKSIRLRGEKSDGLLVGFSSLYNVLSKKWVDHNVQAGDSFNTLNGILICEKYIPQKKQSNAENNIQTKNKNTIKDKFPLFEEHIDTKQLAYNLGSFREGDLITISLKMHGTSARTGFSINKEKPKLVKRAIHKLFRLEPANNWSLISGTRRVVLDTFQGGFYGSNEFRIKYHNLFDGKLRKGETIYGEIVGYASEDSPIMAVGDNKKLKDKQFVKQYGDTTTFTYGCKNGESDFYAYRMTMTNEDGSVVEYPTWLTQIRCEQMGIKHVPIFETFKYTTEDDLLERVSRYEDGADPIGKTHIREGVIVRIENREKFEVFKQKNYDFKILEGIIKEDAVEPDMEESQDLI